MNDKWIELSRKRTRNVMWFVGLGLGGVLLVLGVTSWAVASQPAKETPDLVAQMQMLLAVFQGMLGLAIGLTTIFYAGRTGEMVESMHHAARASVEERRRSASDRLVEAVLEVAVEARPMAHLQKQTWRSYIPGYHRSRDALLQQMFLRLASGMAAAAKAADSLKALEPHLVDEVDELVGDAEHALDAAVAGEVSRATAAAGAIRQRADRLRQSEIAAPRATERE